MKLHQESFRALIRSISIHEKDILKMCDNNNFVLSFLESQLASKATGNAKDGDGNIENGTVTEDMDNASSRPSMLDLYTKETPLVVDNRENEIDENADGGISMVIDRKKKTKKSKKKLSDVPDNVVPDGHKKKKTKTK